MLARNHGLSRVLAFGRPPAQRFVSISSSLVQQTLDVFDNPEGVNLFQRLVGDKDWSKTGLIWDQGSSLDATTTRKFTFGELTAAARVLAGKLSSLGIKQGDKVAVMSARSPELAVASLAIWSLGAVYLPLFTAFGEAAISQRVIDAGAKMIISDSTNAHKLKELPMEVQSKLKFIVANTAGSSSAPCAVAADAYPTFCIDSLMAEASRSNNNAGSLTPAPQGTISSSHDSMVLLFTSGTTGKPKAVDIPIRAMASFQVYSRLALGLGLEKNPADSGARYLCSADCGWAYGSYFNLLSPLSLGLPLIYYQQHFTVEVALSLLARHKITHYASAPTAFRVIRAGADEAMLAKYRDTISQNLRYTSAAGEPLNAELQAWWAKSLRLPVREGETAIRDHYGQTEQGMMANQHWLNPDDAEAADGKKKISFAPGSMGNSMPGLRVVVLNSKGEEVTEEPGEVAVDTDPKVSPLLWFRGYYNNPEKTKERFIGEPTVPLTATNRPIAANYGRYYLTGDVATRIVGNNEEELRQRETLVLNKQEGQAASGAGRKPASSGASLERFWFRSRSDDVITTSGYRVGPSEVEGALMRHPDVAESIVVGLPDPEGLRGEVIAAFVVFKKGSPSEALRLKAIAAGKGEGSKQMEDKDLKGLALALKADVKLHLSAHEQPRYIEFLEALPKTPSGKLQRFLLKGKKVEQLL
jgi:acetyl-CoA synthetase